MRPLLLVGCQIRTANSRNQPKYRIKSSLNNNIGNDNKKFQNVDQVLQTETNTITRLINGFLGLLIFMY